MSPEVAANRIHTLQLHTRVRNTPALRMHIARTANAIDFRPRAMAPSSILYIDKLVGKLPGATPGSGATLPGIGDWRSGVQDQLEHAFKTAARPVTGRVSGRACAVLFRDRGELLACLCRDALEGAVSGHWWWKKNHGPLFHTLSRSAAIRTSLLSAPQHLPAVIEHLADWGLAIPLAALLDDIDADTLTRALLVEFACSRLNDQLVDTVISIGPTDNTTVTPGESAEISSEYPSWFGENSGRRFVRGDNIRSAPGYASRSVGAMASPPWLAMFSAQVWDRRLSRSQACLLGLARTAFMNPALLRNAAFENQVVRWWSLAQSTPAHPHPDSADASPFSPPHPDPASHSRESVTAEIVSLSRQRETADDASSPVGAGANEPGKNSFDNTESNLSENRHREHVERDSSDVLNDSDSQAPPSGDRQRYTDSDREAREDGNRHRVADDNRGHNTDLVLDDSVGQGLTGASDICDNLNPTFDGDEDEFNLTGFSENHIDTELGGLLYLINLLEQLDLPGAMDATWHFETRLGRWGLLELLARGLLSETAEHLETDRLWKLLRKLSARRRSSKVGAHYPRGFNPDYHLCPDWWDFLKSAVDGPVSLQWAVQQNRLRVWCEHCLLIDSAISGSEVSDSDAMPVLERTRLSSYLDGETFLNPDPSPFNRAPLGPLADSLHQVFGAPLCRWVAIVLPFIRFYLRQQLNLEAASGEALAAALLKLPARIYFTSSHIDMVADVDLTSLAIRRSGLDQDPGWQPLYGRVVLFHFSHV